MSQRVAREAPGGQVSPTDEDLIHACRLGRADAFPELAARHAPYMQQLAERLLSGDYHAAQDVVQECLVKLYAATVRDDRPLKVRAWLSVVVRNACMDQHRRRLPEPMAETPDSPCLDEDPFGADPFLDQAWEALPARFRTVLQHRELLGLSYDEIALAMGVSRSAVQTLLFRARGALRREYRRAGGELLGCGAFGFALLSAADGEPVRHAEQFARHLGSCGACQSAVERVSELSHLLRLGAHALDTPAPVSGVLLRCWTALVQFTNTHAPTLAGGAHTAVLAGAVPLSFVAGLIAPAAAPAPAASVVAVEQKSQQATSEHVSRAVQHMTTAASRAGQSAARAVRTTAEPDPRVAAASPWSSPSPSSWSWPWGTDQGQSPFGPRPSPDESNQPRPRPSDGWNGGGWSPLPTPSDRPTQASPTPSPWLHGLLR